MPNKRKYARTLRTDFTKSGRQTGPSAAKAFKKDIKLKEVTDKPMNTGSLTKEQKSDIRSDYIRQYQTEKRKGGDGAQTKALARAGRTAELRSSATGAMNELTNRQALKKSATKKKEDNSPATFNMLVNGRMKQKAEADSGTTFNDKDQGKMGVFNYGMPKE